MSKRRKKRQSPLVAHAERELQLAGLFDKDADYGGAAANHVMDLIRLFSSGSHSGASAQIVISLFTQLANYEVLSDITDDPEEWENTLDAYGPDAGQANLWQNLRGPAYFSHDAGKHWVRFDTGAKGKSKHKVKGDPDANQEGQAEAEPDQSE